MSQRSIAPQINCTPELASIVANASFLWERLDSARFTADNEHNSEPEIDRRLQHWCHVVAQDNWDTLQKRLQWEGSNLDAVRPWLGNVRLTTTESLPEWAETLQQIIQTATDFTSASASFLPAGMLLCLLYTLRANDCHDENLIASGEGMRNRYRC